MDSLVHPQKYIIFRGYHISTAQNEDRFLEGYRVRRSPVFHPKSSEDQKKSSCPQKSSFPPKIK